ncbi:hypothetical protein [Streptomyces sp. CB00072]|uniref:hypothetical protein n=1 Tax=Streptomyces sp. CB00072 TaxID=1703928 RepID=UPI0009399F92
MIIFSARDVRICEACWKAPVTAVRRTPDGRDLLCAECADGNYPRRVDLFPPFGLPRRRSAPCILKRRKHPVDRGISQGPGVRSDRIDRPRVRRRPGPS